MAVGVEWVKLQTDKKTLAFLGFGMSQKCHEPTLGRVPRGTAANPVKRSAEFP
jgi:hypothetical protein